MVKKLKPIDVERAAALLGFALVVAGVAMVYRPAGVIAAGLLLLVGALWRTAR